MRDSSFSFASAWAREAWVGIVIVPVVGAAREGWWLSNQRRGRSSDMTRPPVILVERGARPYRRSCPDGRLDRMKHGDDGRGSAGPMPTWDALASCVPNDGVPRLPSGSPAATTSPADATATWLERAVVAAGSRHREPPRAAVGPSQDRVFLTQGPKAAAAGDANPSPPDTRLRKLAASARPMAWPRAGARAATPRRRSRPGRRVPARP